MVWCSVFSPRLADGNQSIVVRLDSWPEKTRLGAIAGFLGTTETTFVVLKHRRLEIRWFAGSREVPLCGHCALAASSVLLPTLKDGELLEVANLPGRLWLSRQGVEPYIVFRDVPLIEIPAETVQVGVKLLKAFDAGRDYLLIVEDEQALKDFDPKQAGLERLEKIGCILSSRCTSGRAAFRFFAPRAGIEEDRASGSVVPALMEYWAREQPGEQIFSQESGHGIKIRTRWLGDKIAVTGEVLQFARGTISSAALEKIYSAA
ncbi:MAG TPA: PhzF family phenazine biosynthesis protein [Candidatus Angelobacter sp.]